MRRNGRSGPATILTIWTLLTFGCGGSPRDAQDAKRTLPQARKGFATAPGASHRNMQPVPAPPAEVARLVKYEAPVGALPAYLTRVDGPGPHPAIVWISGGDSATIDDGFFRSASSDNDQTASAFRRHGIVTLYPSLRGGNDNPGRREGFYGEVDDILAAAAFLEDQPNVDPERIYLGGHSTGGTLAMLAAASTDGFRAVFAFGPVDHVAGYGPEFLPFDLQNAREFELRDPIRWLHSIRSPTFVIEGTGDGNLSCLRTIQRTSKNPLVRCVAVPGRDHFGVLAPLTEQIARKILADTGPTTNIVVGSD